MSLNFSHEDVRKHLESLGYTDVSKSQLRDFIRDLRRLIRYEEKQKKIQELLQYEANVIRGQENRAPPEPVKSFVAAKSAKASTERKIKKTLKQERKTLNYSKYTGDFSLTSEAVTLSYEESSSSSRSEEVRIEVKVPSRDRPDGKTVVRKQLRVQNDKEEEEFELELKQKLPPKPEIPTKATCSFIRPRLQTSKKGLRHDPVALHQFYKNHWEKAHLPGEETRETKELRWAVREWMMGEPKKD